MLILQAVLLVDGFIFLHDYGWRCNSNDAALFLQACRAVTLRYRLGPPSVHCQRSGGNAALGSFGEFVCPRGEEVAFRPCRGKARRLSRMPLSQFSHFPDEHALCRSFPSQIGGFTLSQNFRFNIQRPLLYVFSVYSLLRGAQMWVGLFLGLSALIVKPGDNLLFISFSVLGGLGMGGYFATPEAMKPDVVDYDEFRTGAR